MPTPVAVERRNIAAADNPFAVFVAEASQRVAIPASWINAGPARYEDHLATGRALPAETRAYVVAVAPLVGGVSVDGTMIVKAAARSWTEASLFALDAESSETTVVQ
jgi:hypothetical protein